MSEDYTPGYEVDDEELAALHPKGTDAEPDPETDRTAIPTVGHTALVGYSVPPEPPMGAPVTYYDRDGEPRRALVINPTAPDKQVDVVYGKDAPLGTAHQTTVNIRRHVPPTPALDPETTPLHVEDDGTKLYLETEYQNAYDLGWLDATDAGVNHIFFSSDADADEESKAVDGFIMERSKGKTDAEVVVRAPNGHAKRVTTDTKTTPEEILVEANLHPADVKVFRAVDPDTPLDLDMTLFVDGGETFVTEAPGPESAFRMLTDHDYQLGEALDG